MSAAAGRRRIICPTGLTSVILLPVPRWPPLTCCAIQTMCKTLCDPGLSWVHCRFYLAAEVNGLCVGVIADD